MVLPHWELLVLSRSVAYPNLSGAASQVGISQPQLSRIVSKLEDELGVVLLDRTARRKSGWTPIAYRVAELYSKSVHRLGDEMGALVEDNRPKQLSVGTLEGLIPLACRYANAVFKELGIEVLKLDVLDLNALEESFFKSEMDLIFSIREPGRKKFKNSKLLGYQSLQAVEKRKGPQILSSFEYETATPKRAGRDMKSKEAKLKDVKSESDSKFVSNSLEVRKYWMEKMGGAGILPSEVRLKRTMKSDKEVLLIGSDLLHSTIWDAVSRQ